MTKKKKRNMTKAQSEAWHFKQAIRERYGIFCNRFLYRCLTDAVRNSESEFVLQDTNTRTIHKLFLQLEETENGKYCVMSDDTEISKRTHYIKVPLEENGTIKIYVVYDKLRKTLVTALPWAANDDVFIECYKRERNK